MFPKLDMKQLPKKLYKYRTFNTNSIRLLCNDEIYYANPDVFNDPLDCKPTIKTDIYQVELLEDLYKEMFNSAQDKKEISCRILQTAYDEETTATEIIDRINEVIKERGIKEIENKRYMSTELADEISKQEVDDHYIENLVSNIKRLLDNEMASRGVLSLAERWDCPLMWSHYADEHRGICIEYEMSENICSNIKNVNYKGPRNIKLTDLIDWKLHKSTKAEKNILNTYFFTKATDWEYEKEWRDIHISNGIKPAPFRISGVYFGLRCDNAVRTSIVSLPFKNINSISFYNLYANEFDLE